MLTLNYIRHFAELHAEIAYALIIIGVILEGEIVVVIAGIFAHLGSINIFYAFVATIFGGSLKSVLGYSFGYYLQNKHSNKKLVHQAQHRVSYFLPNFHKRPFWSIFLSRFLILGIHWFGLIYTGYQKIKIRTFARAEALSLLVWSVIMLSVGYFFSFAALSISRDVRKFLGILLIFFIGFFILEKIIAFIIELWQNIKAEESEK